MRKRGALVVLSLCLMLLVGTFAQAKIVLKAATVLTDAAVHTKAMHYFAGLVAEKTNGEVEVIVYSGGQLGSERDYVEGLRLGTIEMAKTATAPLSRFVPEIDVLNLPYLFEGEDHLFDCLNSELGEALQKVLVDQGFRLVSWFYAGSRNVYNSRRPVNSPEDLRGMKIRVMESPIMVATLNAMGASAVPMAFGELYSAMQQGVVDGAENNPETILSQKHYEVTKYFTYTHHFYDVNAFLISESAFQRLPKNVQEVVLEAGKMAEDYERRLWAEAMAEAQSELEKRGMVFNEPDLTRFREAVQSIYDDEKLMGHIDKRLLELVRQ